VGNDDLLYDKSNSKPFFISNGDVCISNSDYKSEIAAIFCLRNVYKKKDLSIGGGWGGGLANVYTKLNSKNNMRPDAHPKTIIS